MPQRRVGAGTKPKYKSGWERSDESGPAAERCRPNCVVFNKSHKLLIKTMFLIMLTTTTICQIDAAATAAAATATVSAASATSAAVDSDPKAVAEVQQQVSNANANGVGSEGVVLSRGARWAAGMPTSALSHTQKRQLQQQQLFAMLTRNRQEALGQRKHRDYDAEEDEASSASGTSLEITGFVADDGQQYERADKFLKSYASTAEQSSNNNSNNNNPHANGNNCPKECKCLNDYFDCGKNQLDFVPVLPNFVQVLDLVGNRLNDTTVLQIRNLPELHKLNLKRNQLEQMPVFVGLVGLKHVNLANNRIQLISSEALAAMPKLKSLNLSRNFVHTLQSSNFPAVNRIAHLLLNYNEISTVDENAFEHMGNLLDLDLSNNSLGSLPPGVFRNLTKLRKLSLNSNYLEINWSTFKGLQSVQELHLKSNNIRALTDGVFHVMRGIETIELDNNGITSLSRQGLFNLTKLQHLSLSNNSITRIELDTWEFTQSLVQLDLSHNNISEFKPQHLDCLQRLRYLNLGHNKIEYLTESTFDCVKNLEELNLRRNRLSWIIEDQGAAPTFKSLRKLKKLDLYGNNLKQITSKSLNGLASLESLNLGGNALASIQSNAFEHTSHLQKLTFKSLNFICDCELLWFRRWLQRYAQGNGKVQKNAVCGYPDHLLDRELLSLTEADLICADTPKPVILQEPTNQLAVKGANITMECVASSPTAALLAATDELKIKWRHDNHNVKGESMRGHFQGNHSYVVHSYSTTDIQIDHDQATNMTTIIGHLRLYNVSYENAGRYQCVISNAFGTTYSQKFKISIGIHPTFLQIPSNLTIDSGETARLVCSAAGDPTPEIALQKFDASDFPAAIERRLQVIREENAFVITNAKPIDTGIYTCTAESAAGEIKINASLVVNDKPQPSVPIVRQEVVVGRSCVLECVEDLAAELNQPSREWYKENKPFHTSSTSASERHYFTAEKELLVIVKAQPMDAGQYRCEITDNTKTIVMKMELVVVKEDSLNDILYVILIVLVGVACLLLLSLCTWLACRYFRRKRRFPSNSSIGLHHSRGRVSAADHVIHSSRGSTLDQTHLTTLNRTYRQQPHEQQQQQRPCYLDDIALGMAEQRNRLIGTPTANFEQLMQRGPHDVEEEITLHFLHRNSLHHNGAEYHPDHLSSKDSGTGSDAAVKPSLEDVGDDEDADGDDFVPSHAVGVSEYGMEMSPLNARVAASRREQIDASENDSERERFLKDNNNSNNNANSSSHLHQPSHPHGALVNGPASYNFKRINGPTERSNFDGGGSDADEGGGCAASSTPVPHPPTKCKASLSTNFNVVAGDVQAVDI